jgi:hypothetical protein
MRAHPLQLAGLSVAVIGIAVTWTSLSAATAQSSPVSLTHRSASPLAQVHPAVGITCAKQNDNDNGIGIVSQNFESESDSFDSRGSDDFIIDETCTVSEVDVSGAYFNGSGPADSLHVTFYQDDGGRPGRRFANENLLAYTDTSGTGSFAIPLVPAVTFEPGTYWVAVKANMDFVVGGEWGWNTNNKARGHNADWKNGGDGFGTGCRKYTELLTCIPSGEGPDFSFLLRK